jgi:cytochrome c-type biogenesis protein CcmH
VRRVALLALAALALAPAALASEAHPTLNELENEVMCPVCGTTLAQSDSDAAKQIERVIRQKIAAGYTKSQIKDILVQQYGKSILAAPPKEGFDLLAWLLPLAGVILGAALLGVAAWRWTQGRAEAEDAPPVASMNGRGQLDPDVERRLDEELARFD